MILAKLNQPEFEYDIHSLIKAFYPEQNVSATAEEKEYDEEILWRLDIDYAQEQISIVLSELAQVADCEGSEDTNASEPTKCFLEKMSDSFAVDFSDRTKTKNQLKQHLYQMLKQYSEKELPWGTLTGIRPTKIPMKLLEEGKSREEIEHYMKDTYFASDEKIDLSIDIAEREL